MRIYLFLIKGTVNGFFNNIDLDSELKTINQVDTQM